MKLLIDLLESLKNSKSKFRPTEIYNEGWLLRILLNEYSKKPDIESPLKFYPGADWYSEAMLPTRFKARNRDDKQAESRTNADGVIGHFNIGEKGKADLELKNDTKQFTVIEAKMKSPLTKGTKNASYYDQAARTVACMAEALSKKDLCGKDIDHISFLVIAPREKIISAKKERKPDGLSSLVKKENIEGKVKDRVVEYKEGSDKFNKQEHKYESYLAWHENYFKPLLELMNIELVSWESEITKLPDSDPVMEFYEKCHKYN